MICLTCIKKSKCPIYESTKKTNAKVRKCNGYKTSDSNIPEGREGTNRDNASRNRDAQEWIEKYPKS